MYKSEKYNVQVDGGQTKRSSFKPSNQVTNVLESERTCCYCYETAENDSVSCLNK